MNRNIFIAAVVVTGVGVGLLLMYKERFEKEALGGTPDAVLMATQDIPSGTRLTESMIGVRRVPRSYKDVRHINAADADRLIGVRVNAEIPANSSILWSDVATASTESRGFSEIVAHGMRAITIQVESTPGRVGLLSAGDRVDVLLTSGDSRSETLTIPLIQNVLVLAVGSDSGTEGRERSGTNFANHVTLATTMEQAQTLALSENHGRMTLILRNPDDIGIVDTPQSSSRDLMKQDRAQPSAVHNLTAASRREEQQQP